MAARLSITLFLLLAATSATRGHAGLPADQTRLSRTKDDGVAVLVRPFSLAASVTELAGRHVKVLQARVVGVFEPRVFVIDSAAEIHYPTGFHRDRVVVLVHPGELRVSPNLLVGSTVTVIGVAQTILGARVSNEVPWPDALVPKLVQRLEIRAVVAASSVQTPEGVELTDNSAPQTR